jgi:hypothetical protein
MQATVTLCSMGHMATSADCKIGDVVTAGYVHLNRSQAYEVKRPKRVSLKPRICFFLVWCLRLNDWKSILGTIRRYVARHTPWWAVQQALSSPEP